jgi:hypothetical protein
VPWPLPTRGGGATTLALYLLLFGQDYRQGTQRLKCVDSLYRQIGIKTTRPAHAERMFSAALAQVNAHLTKLGAGTTFKITGKQDGTCVHIQRLERADKTPVHRASALIVGGH